MAFALYLLYLIASYLRPAELRPELADLRLMLWLGWGAFAAALIKVPFGNRVNWRMPQIWLMLGLIACIMISQITNGWTGGAIAAFVSFGPSFLMFFLTILNVNSWPKMRIVAGLLVILTLIATVQSIAGFHFGYLGERLVIKQGVGEESETGEYASYIYRIKHLGFLNDPNDLGQAIVFVLPFLAAAWQSHRLTRNVLVILVPLLILIYGVYLTHSRGALLGMALVLFLPFRGRINKTWTAALIVLVVIGVLALNVSGGREFSSKEQSAAERIDAWSQGIQMLRSAPGFGVGYGNFTEHNELTAHNSFVLCFAELGLIGYFFWLSLIAITLYGLWQSAKTDPEQCWPRVLLHASAGFLLCAWFLSRTYIPNLYLLLGLATAAVALASPAEEQETLPLFRWTARAVVLELATIAAVYFIVRVQHVVI
jgi:hypothetical protein